MIWSDNDRSSFQEEVIWNKLTTLHNLSKSLVIYQYGLYIFIYVHSIYLIVWFPN